MAGQCFDNTSCNYGLLLINGKNILSKLVRGIKFLMIIQFSEVDCHRNQSLFLL